ncbi:MAG: hypothetical protein JW768_16225, partial [Chitinispirillaceae bacterium]|nr:hypothetical protein [Chitinispirillaceae bacterium]
HMVNDIAAVLTLGWQGVLEKKRLGGLTRNAVQKISRLLHGPTGAKKEDALAQLLVHCCMQSGLLEEQAEQYDCVPAGCAQWLERPIEDRSQELRECVIAYTGSWRMPLVNAILDAAGQGQWFSSRLFPERERESVAAMCCQLAWAGVTAIADSNGETLFRAPSSNGQPGHENGNTIGRPLTVLPDFSAIIRPDTPSIDLFRFGQTGVLHSLDRVYKGSIDRAILSDSLARGVDGNEILHWLDGWEAPSNVAITVQEWIREFNRLCVTSDTMLLVCDEKVEYQLNAFEPLCGLVEKVPAKAAYRIRPGGEGQVRALLGGMGFDDRMPRHDAHRLGTQAEKAMALPGDMWEPILTEQAQVPRNSLVLRGKKYGAGLKSVDLNETIHIIDYAILTGQELVFEYAGSPHVKKGRYTVQPRSCTRGANPVLDVAERNGRSRQFLVRRISAIGVGHS